MMRRSFFAILAFIGTIGPASAQPPLDVKEVRRDVVVTFHDLNLNDERDAEILLSRIDKAAEQACGGRPVTLYELDSSRLREEYRRCHMDAEARAVEKVGAPLLKRQLASAD
jgi:UrcA family protein